MVNLIIILICIASFALYNSAKNTQIKGEYPIEKWFQRHLFLSKVIGFMTMITSLLLAVKTFGSVSGIIVWLGTIMAVFSITILVYPMRSVTYKHIVLFFVITFIIEFIS